MVQDLIVILQYSITSKLDSPGETISLADARFVLQKYKQHLNKNSMMTFDVHGGMANLAS